ncbi:MAG: TonB-dependent receptor [Deltaproteobacteria bacterium]|nr:MAG: TonB-dependent receptor [Deltaproteobacteria bacterium]
MPLVRNERVLSSRRVSIALVIALGAVALRSFAQTAEHVRPPAVEKKVDATFPTQGLGTRHQVKVVVRVTVATDGTVVDPEIVESGGPAFDAAVLDAVRRWKFRPALRGDVPVPSRIRIPFLFVPPAAAGAAGSLDGGVAAPPVAIAEDAGVPAAVVSSLDGGIAAPVPDVTQPPASEGSEAAPAEESVRGRADGGEEVIEVTAATRRHVPTRGTSDFQIETAQLAEVPRGNASEFLKLAPGVLLTNEGGEGHAEQVFLRGFDAREGQDVEFSVDGVPINESGNFHGNGYSDTHFIIPELVQSLRVLEGPFDPRQGNYAVAGSAEFHLGLTERGLLAKVSDGSYGTRRALIAYGPPGSSTGTFAAAQLYQTDGYGQNRDGHSASAMAQYEARNGSSLYRVTAQAYTASFHTAGVLREDDFAAGRVGFYDTYDFLQGEDAARYSIAAAVESRTDRIAFTNQVFAIYRPLRLREDFTGFLLDVQEPDQRAHAQRGDLIDLQVKETTLGARGSARLSGEWLDLQQQIELGYFARHDIASGFQQRIEAATRAPYLTEANLDSNLDDIGLYADANLRFLPWLALRGGFRADLFTYNVQNLCAVRSVEHPSPTSPEPDVSCKTQEGTLGAHREPNQSASTASSTTMPRASVIVGPWAGVSLSASYGRGVRSIDPVYITQDRATPFASVTATEAGMTFEGTILPDVRMAFGTAIFRTHVDQDLIFSQTAGRNTLAGGTTRVGSASAVRISGPVFDVSVNGTYVHATLDDTGLLIPYVPDLVLRGDGAVFTDLPWKILNLEGRPARITLATGITFVGRRPLPFGTRSDRIFTIDTNVEIGWPILRVGLSVTNLLDSQYRLGEYNFASDFHSQSQPTLVPVRHFAAGAPRALLFTITTNFGGSP